MTVATYRYDAWGNHSIYDAFKGIQIYRSGRGITVGFETHSGIINPIRYRGKYHDRVTGFIYMNTRFYCSQLRRFIAFLLM